MTTTRTILIASARRRWPSRLGVRGLLAAPLALLLPSLALADGIHADDTDSCGGGVEILVEDVPAPRCDTLLGDDEVRSHNESWRSDRIKAVDSGSRTLDVVHTDAQLRRPEVRSLSGMVVREIFDAEVRERCADESDDAEFLDAGPDADGGLEASREVVLERVARVELEAPWAEICGEETVVLRVDDALGERGRVLHIDRRGVLAHLGGQLVWLSRQGVEAPVFRTTWRSSFSVIPDSVKKPAPKPKRKATRSRRGRRR